MHCRLNDREAATCNSGQSSHSRPKPIFLEPISKYATVTLRNVILKEWQKYIYVSNGLMGMTVCLYINNVWLHGVDDYEQRSEFSVTVLTVINLWAQP